MDTSSSSSVSSLIGKAGDITSCLLPAAACACACVCFCLCLRACVVVLCGVVLFCSVRLQRPTIINPGLSWNKTFQKTLLSAPASRVVETDEPTIGVDTEADVRAVEAWLAAHPR